MTAKPIDHAALLAKAIDVMHAAYPWGQAAARGPVAAAIYTQLCAEARDEQIANLHAQIEIDTATAGLLADVCDAAFGDGHAERHGYEVLVERVRVLAYVAKRAADFKAAPSENHREHAEAMLWNALDNLKRMEPKP